MERANQRTKFPGVIRVALVDDQTMVRQGLRLILSGESDIDVVGEGGTGSDALHLARHSLPDVLVLELMLPKRDSLEIIKELTASSARLRVLVLTRLGGAQGALRSLRAGASGYVPKESDSRELLTAIRAVHRGKGFVPAELREQILDQFVGPSRSDKGQAWLSDRELQVSQLLVSGISNREIAATLSISVKTVDAHRGNVLRKLGLRNNADLARYALQMGLLE